MTKKSKAIIEIENLQGRFTHFWNAGRFDMETHLFAPGEKTWFARPDFDEKFTGKTAIDAWFTGLLEKIDPDPVVRNFQFCHTPAIEVAEDLEHARASYMVTVYDITSGREGYQSEQWEARYDADLVYLDGRWYFETLQFYIIMSLYPETFTPSDPGRSINVMAETILPPKVAGFTEPKDFILLQKIIGRWCQNRRLNGMEAFSAYEKISLSLPNLLEGRQEGYDEVGCALDYLDEMEAANRPYYLSIPMICSPVIEASEDGMRAEGSWLALVLDTIGPAYKETDPNAQVRLSAGRFRVSFIRELGAWKILSLSYEPYLQLPYLRINYETSDTTMLRFSGNNWMYAPEPTGNHSDQDLEDILQLEQYIAFWAGGLRYRSEAPFYETKFAKERPELLTYSTRGSLDPKVYRFDCSRGLEDVTKKIFEMVNKFNTLQPKSPGNHIGTTPVIEIMDDHQHAVASWLDFGWTTMAEVFGLKEPPYAANPAIARYEHRYEKIDGVWKLYGFKWTPLMRTGKWQFDYEHSRGWTHTTSCRRIPLPLGNYIYEDDPERRGEKIVLEKPCIISPLEQPWEGQTDKMR